jgi:hypothetical protein
MVQMEEQPPTPSPTMTTDEVEQTIAEQLGESEPEPLQLLRKVVKKLGPEQALAFLKETQEVEAQGGLLLPDGSRRRTPGGVFFYLVRTKAPKPVRFLFWQQKQAQSAASPQSPPTFTWAERIAALDEIGSEKGAASTVKITVIGRPGKVIDRGDCIVTSLQSTKVPSLPKGLPTPPNAATTYTLYIASKQWRRVAEAIKDPEDTLIVEGFPQLDAQIGSIAVFVTNTTTKKLQQAQRQVSDKNETQEGNKTTS